MDTAARSAFVSASGWDGAASTQLQSDASPRQYHRLTRPDGTSVILMDAGRDVPGSLSRFITVAETLRLADLSAPAVYAADIENGFALIEDFGLVSLASMHRAHPATALPAFVETVRLLDRLRCHALPGWAARPDLEELADMVSLTFERLAMPSSAAKEARAILADALAETGVGDRTLALRDVHADNLMWLPDRTGIARVGLLDFQDALALPCGYDLASLIDDPRRVIDAEWRDILLSEAADRSGTSLDELKRRVTLLSVPRNLRILGIFHRLSTDAGRPSYAAFLPRVAFLLRRAAEDLQLPRVACIVDDTLTQAAPWFKRPAA